MYISSMGKEAFFFRGGGLFGFFKRREVGPVVTNRASGWGVCR